ncbi:MAG: exodeoxyribonuclease VII small subunit [Patescibacteria group bacterium]
MAKENLESALKQLEKIVEDLGRKDVDVEAGLQEFKEGVDLIKFCRGQLQKAENEFKKLKEELEEDTETKNRDAEEEEEANDDQPDLAF